MMAVPDGSAISMPMEMQGVHSMQMKQSPGLVPTDLKQLSCGHGVSTVLDNVLAVTEYLRASSVAADMGKGPRPKCHSPYCATPYHRLHACLTCVFIGCVDHIQAHLTSSMMTASQDQIHCFALDLNHVELYCNTCQDYVIDPSVEQALARAPHSGTAEGKIMGSSSVPSGAVSNHQQQRLPKRPRDETYYWKPSTEEQKLLSSDTLPVAAVPTAPVTGNTAAASPPALGLRGLYNLGNTCFMNVTLQALVHNPLIRNYFLADMHNRRLCPSRRAPGAGIASLSQAQLLSRLSGPSPNPGQGANKALASPSHGPADSVAAAGAVPSLALSGGAATAALGTPAKCIGCNMDSLFEQFFSGESEPYVPSFFLFSMWSVADHLAGYEQQDAHEFLISVLDSIHGACGGSHKACTCIIHRVFGGQLRSDVTCTHCGNTSTAFDPIFDISLDLKDESFVSSSDSSVSPVPVTPAGQLPLLTSSPASAIASPSQQPLIPVAGVLDLTTSPGAEATANGASASLASPMSADAVTGPVAMDSTPVGGGTGAISTVPVGSPSPLLEAAGGGALNKTPVPAFGAPPNSSKKARLLFSPSQLLSACLERFVRPELLGNQERFNCRKCNHNASPTKQFSVHTLPMVLTFHLKRFEHSTKKQQRSTKIDTFVEFPMEGLDMTPYLTAAVKNPLQQRSAQSPGSGRSPSSSEPELYDLFAVIVHIGTMDNGHYVCYVRRDMQWFKCDDTYISPVSAEEVRASKAYLLFYIKRHMRYQAPRTVQSGGTTVPKT